MSTQQVVSRKSRLRLLAFVVVFTVVASYGIGASIDQHVHRCMTFGTVIDERHQRICNLTVPFHDHPVGGIEDEALQRAIDRARFAQPGP